MCVCTLLFSDRNIKPRNLDHRISDIMLPTESSQEFMPHNSCTLMQGAI